MTTETATIPTDRLAGEQLQRWVEELLHQDTFAPLPRAKEE